MFTLMKFLLIAQCLHMSFSMVVVELPGNEKSVEPVSLPLGKSLSLDSYTTCLQLQITEISAKINIFKEPGPEFDLLLKTQQEYGFLHVNGDPHIFKIPGDAFSPSTWYYFCFIFGPINYTMIAQGEVWYTFERPKKTAYNNVIDLKELVFGDHETSEGGKGEVSNLNIWSFEIEAEKLLDLTSRKKGMSNTIPSPDVLDWSKIGLSNFRGNLELVTVRDEVENSGPKLAHTTLNLELESAVEYCRVMGGKLFIPWENNKELLKTFQWENGDCSEMNRSWVAVQEVFKGKWISLHDPTLEVQALTWEKTEPNGNDLQQCAVMDLSAKVFDTTCKLSKYCSICQFDQDVHFNLRGLGHQLNIDQHYILFVDSGKYVFKGYKSGSIEFIREKKIWVLKKDQFELSAKAINPVGTKRWYLDSPRSEVTGSPFTLKLTKCKQREFTCENGDCIDLDNRCNDIFDCNDKSDEDNCKIIEIDGASYRPMQPPIERGHKTEVLVTIFIDSIGAIDELSMKFSSNLRLLLAWRDSRLTFNNLKANGTTLPAYEHDQIWLPNLVFSNSIGSQKVLSGTGLAVEVMRNDSGVLQGLEYLNEGKFYLGSKNDINLHSEHELDFNCTYNLKHYPFDTQKCNIDLQIPPHLKGKLKIVIGIVEYLGDLQLAQFGIENWTATTELEGRMMRIKITLKRTPIYHITTTYIPTGCILIMAISTLYIDDDHFEATIMVSLTSMLVMYTLFQSISDDMPNTAYLKVLDYWLIFGLILPFVIFIIEVIWELKRAAMENKVRPMNESPKRVNKRVIQIGLPIICIIFTAGYITCVSMIYFS